MVSFNFEIDINKFNQEKVVLDGRKEHWLRDIVRPQHLEYSGTHDIFGILILSGPKFRKGIELKEASVLDITPTILHLFGEPIAEDMDGQVLKDVFEDEHIKPMSTIETYEDGSPIPTSQIEDEEVPEDLKDRLRSLGYLD